MAAITERLERTVRGVVLTSVADGYPAKERNRRLTATGSWEHEGASVPSAVPVHRLRGFRANGLQSWHSWDAWSTFAVNIANGGMPLTRTTIRGRGGATSRRASHL